MAEPGRLRRRASSGNADADLVSALVVHDRGAMAVAYERHGDAVYRFALRLCGQQRAEEVTHEVFGALWRDPRNFDLSTGSLRMPLLLRAHGQSVIGHRISGLCELPFAEDLAIALAHFGGYSYQQVAAAVHQPNAAVAADMLAGLRRLDTESP